MVDRGTRIDSALDLNNSKVCVQEGTTTLLNVADYFRANNMKYTEMKFPKLDDVVKAYSEGKCDTLTADVSQLYALRLNLAKPGDLLQIELKSWTAWVLRSKTSFSPGQATSDEAVP